MRCVGVVGVGVVLVGCAGSAAVGDRGGGEASVREELEAHAEAVRPLYPAPLVLRFLDTFKELPAVAPRTIYHDDEKTRWIAREAWEALAEEAQAGWTAVVMDEAAYYTTRYGSPVSYARPLAVAADHGFDGLDGRRILDFGFGYLTHLTSFARLGAEVHGVEVDERLRALYSAPGDTGPVAGGGSVTLHYGRLPDDVALLDALGGGFDLIVTKNVLKRGFVQPQRPAGAKPLLDLGDPAMATRMFHDLLAPGGLMLIYNLCPPLAAPDEPFIPWADCRAPYDAGAWKDAGFTVLAYDEDDDTAIRTLARALSFEGANTLWARYTVLQRPPSR